MRAPSTSVEGSESSSQDDDNTGRLFAQARVLNALELEQIEENLWKPWKRSASNPLISPTEDLFPSDEKHQRVRNLVLHKHQRPSLDEENEDEVTRIFLFERSIRQCTVCILFVYVVFTVVYGIAQFFEFMTSLEDSPDLDAPNATPEAR